MSKPKKNDDTEKQSASPKAEQPDDPTLQSADDSQDATKFDDSARREASTDESGLSETVSPEDQTDATMPAKPFVRKPAGKSSALYCEGYEILQQIGRGAMGVVYKARHVKLNRVVALKMILAGVHAGKVERERFQRETEAVARFQHPNIVQIFDVGECEDRPYCALEYIDGGNLQQELADRPMDPNEAARLTQKLAEAIHYAHEHGIVHRDLKPANVLLTTDGVPKITDFGLAKSLEGDSGQTDTGAILGTPSYMAPEQAWGRSKEIGPPADIHALGAVLYDMLTGMPPFQGDTVIDTLQLVQSNDPVPPRRIRPKIPRDLEVICLKCLSKEPSGRYATAKEVAEDIDRFLSDQPIKAKPASVWQQGVKLARRHPLVTGLAAALMLLLVGGFFAMATLWWRAEENANIAESSARDAKKAKDEAIKARDRARNKEAEALAAVEAEQRERDRAEEAKRKAEEAERKTRGVLFAVSSTQAQHAFENAKVGRLQSLLNSLKNNKGFEWRFLTKLFQTSDSFKLKGHTQMVKSVAFRPPNREQVATGSGDGSVIVWNPIASKDKERFHLLKRRHEGPVRKIAFSKDGTHLASASEDGTIHVWDLSEGFDSEPTVLTGHNNWILSLAFGPATDRLVTGGRDRTVRVWDLVEGKQLRKFDGHEYAVTDVAFAPDGKSVASASKDRTVRVWDIGADSAERIRITDHDHWVTSVAFSPDGSVLASAAWNQDVRTWDAATGRQRLKLAGAPSSVTSLAFSPGGSRLGAVCDDQTVLVWDLPTTKKIRQFPGRPGVVQSVAFSPDGERIGKVVFDIAGQTSKTLDSRNGALLGVSMSQNRLVAAPSADSKVWIWDLQTDSPVSYALEGHEGPVRAAAFHTDGSKVATASEDNTVRIWDLESKKVQTLQGHSRWVTCLAFSKDGSRLVSGSVDQTIRVWDVKTGSSQKTLKGHKGPVNAVCFSADDKLIASGSDDKTVKLWNATTGELMDHLKTKSQFKGPVFAVAFDPKGDLLAAAGWDKQIQLWDVKTGTVRASLDGHTQQVAALAFSADGKRLASGSADHTVKVWDPATGQETLTLKGHSFPVTGVAFSSDGRRLVSSSWDKTIRVWESDD